MSLRANTANGGAGKQPSTALSQDSKFLEYLQLNSLLTCIPGEEKQKRLLASDAGHFSMIKYTLPQPTHSSGRTDALHSELYTSPT